MSNNTTRRTIIRLPLGAALTATALCKPALAQRARSLRLGSPQPVAKLYEVSKYMSLTGHVTDFFVVSINNGLWQAMSAEEQGILTRAMKTASDWEWQAQPQTTATAREKLGTLLAINPISVEQHALFAASTKPMYQEYAAVVGQDILDLATHQFAS